MMRQISLKGVTILVIRLSGSLLTSRIIADSVKNSIEFLSQKWGFWGFCFYISFDTKLGLSNSVNSDDGEGHDDGYDDEGDLQDFFNHLSALDCCKTLLFEETATIFLVMMVGMMMSIWHKKNLFKRKKFFNENENQNEN